MLVIDCDCDWPFKYSASHVFIGRAFRILDAGGDRAESAGSQLFEHGAPVPSGLHLVRHPGRFRGRFGRFGHLQDRHRNPVDQSRFFCIDWFTVTVTSLTGFR